MPIDAATSAFRAWGKANGFSRKGTTLYRDQTETCAVVNLQGSQWGGRYYINVALWLKALGDEAFPRENHCHIRTRLDDLLENEEDLETLLDMGSALLPEERAGRLRTLMDQNLTPVLVGTDTVASIREHRQDFLSRCLIDREAGPLLAAD